jgi:hypothetical protein
MGKHKKNTIVSEAQQQAQREESGFFEKYGAFLIMTGLIAYVILLAIGTFAEIFKIQSILDWWIWSPPGNK